jgi:arabinan endo-1,5-alpha-L-arabinosidase
MKLARLALAMSGLLILSGCGGGGDNKSSSSVSSLSSSSSSSASQQPVYSKPVLSDSIPFNDQGRVAWQDIGVHDPSIIKAGSEYYIFGSHLAAAKSTDLLNWEYISVLSANDRVDESPLFNTYSTEIAEGINWTDGFKGNWAADVIQAPNGKYWFYYNHCAQTEADNGGCWNRSYLGLAEADSVGGPYINKGVFLRSGYRTPAEFVAHPLDNGQTTWNGAVDPNAIDPAAFFDKSGELWMVYGSYSGGIFVLAMDKATGMPKAGQGYGTHLLGSDFRAIEGAYAIYSPVSDYYYLFYSVAGFAANDGYNIRIARSRQPQGPYFDPAGNDVANMAGTLEVGGKLMGGFEFTRELGEEAPSWGYQSPGHNSAWYDAESGRHLLITHTRFPSGSTAYAGNAEAHAVRTHEMFVNNQGWLVASPQRYVPLDGENLVDVAQIAGYYKFINQGKGVNNSAIQSGYLALNSNGTVTGSETGSWIIEGEGNIKLELTSGVYYGVVKWQWDDGLKTLVPVFSAMSLAGESIWGSRTTEASATAESLAAVVDALDIKTELSIVDEEYSLPVIGKDGTLISWQSSDQYFIAEDGSIFIPTPDQGDRTVTLTANLALNGSTASKVFTVNLKARPAFRNAIAHYRFDGSLLDSLGNHAAALPTDNNLLNVNATSPVYTEGYAGQAFDFTGANGIRLPNEIIKSAEYTVAFWAKAETLTGYTPAFFGAAAADQWISYIPGSAPHFTSTSLVWSNIAENWGQIIHSATAPLNQWQHVAITYANGTMRLYIDGALSGSMPRPDLFSDAEGVFALGVNYGWDIPFNGQIDEFIVYDYALGSLDINGAALNNLTDPAQFSGFIKNALNLGDITAVRESFSLPRVGPFVSGISWSSDNEDFLKPLNGSAVVNQPGALQGDQQVRLTATIRYQGFTDSKIFDVTIKSLAPAEFSFEGNLEEANEAYSPGWVTGNRIGNTGGHVSYVDGVKGLAVHLDGTAGIRLPDNLITTNSYSISLWLKPETFTDYTTAFFAGASADAWISLVPSMNGSNRTRLWANMGAFFDNAELGYRIAQDKWTHLVMTVDGDNRDALTIYVNGQQALSTNGLPRIFTVAGETNEFALGVNYWDTPFNGAIDELKIFTGVVTAETINTLYQEGAASVE